MTEERRAENGGGGGDNNHEAGAFSLPLLSKVRKNLHIFSIICFVHLERKNVNSFNFQEFDITEKTY